MGQFWGPEPVESGADYVPTYTGHGVAYYVLTYTSDQAQKIPPPSGEDGGRRKRPAGSPYSPPSSPFVNAWVASASSAGYISVGTT